jgi:Uma2 family endonuclease
MFLAVEDLYTMPDDGFTYELQAGLLIAEPRPGFRHGRIIATITEMLVTHVRRRRLGAVCEPYVEAVRSLASGAKRNKP